MPNEQDVNIMLNTYGIDPSLTQGITNSLTFPNIMAWIIFGIIGFFAFKYGWKEKSYKPMVIGLVLMIYPYFVYNTIALYLIGIVVTSLLYFWRD